MRFNQCSTQAAGTSHRNVGVSAASGKRMGYGEYLQMQEAQRGEESIRNNSLVTMRSSTGSQGAGVDRQVHGIVESKGKRMGYGEMLQMEEAQRGEEQIRNNSLVTMRSSTGSQGAGVNRQVHGIVESKGKTAGYGDYLQAQEAARGEEQIRNNSLVTMRSSTGSQAAGVDRQVHGIVESKGKTKGYGDMLQAQEAQRGEEQIKNNSLVTMRSSTGSQGAGVDRQVHGTVESKGKTAGYGDYLQAQEAARGEETIKNNSLVTMRSSSSAQAVGTSTQSNSGTVESSGKTAGYGDMLQALEAARGEETIKNDSLVTMRSSDPTNHGVIEASGGTYSELNDYR